MKILSIIGTNQYDELSARIYHVILSYHHSNHNIISRGLLTHKNVKMELPSILWEQNRMSIFYMISLWMK